MLKTILQCGARGDTNSIADDIAVGDMVAIYETLNNEDGEPGCEPGAQAVILYGKVIRCYPAQEGNDFVLRAKLDEVIECKGASFQKITKDIVPGFSPNFRNRGYYARRYHRDPEFRERRLNYLREYRRAHKGAAKFKEGRAIP